MSTTMETEGKETFEATDEGCPDDEGDEGSCIGDSDDDFQDTVEASIAKSKTEQEPKAYIGACDVCGKGFTSVPGAKFHKKYHHTDGKLYCLKCKKPFKFQADLDRHTKTHTGERPYGCPECDKSFICKSSLMQHLRQQHIVGSVYECDVCNRKFCTSTDLRRHFRIHTGIKPFKCDRCDKCFTCKSSLNTHKRTHQGKKFICSFCEVGFYIESDLRRHETTHTGKKPWKCSLCDKAYSCKSTLKVHEKNMHGIYGDRETGDTRKLPASDEWSQPIKVKRIKLDSVDRVIHSEIDGNALAKEKLKEETEENNSDALEDDISKDIDTLKEIAKDIDTFKRLNDNIGVKENRVAAVVAANIKPESECSIVDVDDIVKTEEGVEAAADGLTESTAVEMAVEMAVEETGASDIDKVYREIDCLNKDGEGSSGVMVVNMHDSLGDGQNAQIVKRSEISDEYLVVFPISNL